MSRIYFQDQYMDPNKLAIKMMKENGEWLNLGSVADIIKASELRKKLLSLPKRTLETLEVGDYVELYDDERIHVGAIMRSDFDLFQIKNDYRAYNCKYKIIPREAINLLRDVIG